MQTRGLLLAGVGLADLALAQLYPVNTTTTTTAAFQVITVVPQIVTAVYTDIFTTYCESATVFIINGEDYSVTTPGHVTLTNCPCTLTSTFTPYPVVTVTTTIFPVCPTVFSFTVSDSGLGSGGLAAVGDSGGSGFCSVSVGGGGSNNGGEGSANPTETGTAAPPTQSGDNYETYYASYAAESTAGGGGGGGGGGDGVCVGAACAIGITAGGSGGGASATGGGGGGGATIQGSCLGGAAACSLSAGGGGGGGGGGGVGVQNAVAVPTALAVESVESSEVKNTAAPGGPRIMTVFGLVTAFTFGLAVLL